MSETKPSMPAQPKTKELPAMTDRALLEDLARTVKAGFERQDSRADSQDERLDSIEKQVDIAVTDGKENNKRITTLEVRFENLRETTSIRVKQPSQHDLEAQAALANEVTAREALALKVDNLATAQAENNEWTKALYDDGKKFFAKHPAIGNACVAIVLGILYVIAKKLGVQL